MNLPNFLSNITTYSNYTFIGLANVVHLSSSAYEVVSEPAIEAAQECYRLLYIRQGSILLQSERTDKKAAPLPAGSVLLSPCYDNLRFRVAGENLDAWIFYLHGNSLPYYKEIIDALGVPVIPAESAGSFESLHRLVQLKQSHSLFDEILVNTILTSLFGRWLETCRISDSFSPVIPGYLSAVKEEFDTHYDSSFSLDELSARYKVNKYKLCRDFSKFYHHSPIQYLNRVRIDNACLLLVSTDMHVGEIAVSVGIENVNHFIRLFKTQTGKTPTEYKNKLL